MRSFISWRILIVSALLSASMGRTPGLALDNRVFLEFSQHIVNQVHQDKQAFARASTCLSWFYKASKTPVPPAQGIVWRPAALQPETDCPRRYPGGMNAARDDFARTQTLLSVSLTVYQFALVADLNDDYAYNAAELQDLFSSLSLTLDTTGAHPPPVAALTERFDHWYRIRNLEEVMKGMNALYERGYRVTADDRAELDRVMK